MNRHEREVTQQDRLMEIMDNCVLCRLAMHDDDGGVYIVPINFGYELLEDDNIRLWFHGAPHGKKLSLLAANPKVGFEMDSNIQLIESPSICSYSYTYMSLVGKGTAKILADDDYDGKRRALKHVIFRQAHIEIKDDDLPDHKLEKVKAFYVDVEEITGKERM